MQLLGHLARLKDDLVFEFSLAVALRWELGKSFILKNRERRYTISDGKMFHPKDKDRMTEVRSAVHGNLNANNENRHRSTAANDSHVNDPQLYTFGVDTNRTMTMRARSSDRHHDLHQNAFVIYDSEGKQLHCPSGHHTNRNSLDHNGPKKDQDALHPRTNDRTNSGTSDGSYHIRYNKYMDQRGYHHFQDFNDSHELGEGLSVGGRESDERRLHYFFACGDSFERRRHRQRYESSVYTSHDAKYYATVQQRDDSYRKRNEIHGGSNRRYIDHDYHNKIGRNNDDCFDHPFNRDHEHHSHQRHLRDLGSLKSSINLHSYQDRRGTRLFAPHPARHENNGNKRNRSRHEDSRHGIPRHGNAQGDTTSQGQPTEGFGKIEQQKKRLREHSPLKTSLRQNHQEDHHQG
jgi:hypothetical protein